jgi:hypothetical protein
VAAGAADDDEILSAVIRELLTVNGRRPAIMVPETSAGAYRILHPVLLYRDYWITARTQPILAPPLTETPDNDAGRATAS